MKISKNNLTIFKTAAQELGLNTEYIDVGKKSKKLCVSDETGKFLLAGATSPGYYPSVTRANAYFSNSKLLSQKLIKKGGYQTISSEEFRVAKYNSCNELLKAIGSTKLHFPVLLKPDTGYRGMGITIAENLSQIKKQAKNHYAKKTDFIVQPIINKPEYRILVVHGEVLLMHSKRNPYVTGNGSATIEQLLNAIPKQSKDEIFIASEYKKYAYSGKTVLKKGEHFAYHLTKKPDTNYYKTTNIPKPIQEWSINFANYISAPVVGIDIFTDEDILNTDAYTIIEINSNPGVDYLIPYCGDKETPYKIFAKVLTNYFSK